MDSLLRPDSDKSEHRDYGGQACSFDAAPYFAINGEASQGRQDKLRGNDNDEN